ncbi:hypothetical protein CMV_024816 [Castanea mollissima]|uniref:Uncharacterized protein n=1 Tax=Castanea mollissima TaxID=60419 RepID=A0A8J4VHK8_9ROSI|nr:hypothetical protein CMV_024816 [Castanea mollissima]
MLYDATQDSPINHSSSIGVRGTIGYTPPEYGMGNETQTKASSHRCTRMMTYYKGLHHDKQNHPTPESFLLLPTPDSHKKIIIRVVNYVRFFIKVMKMSNMKQWNKLKL